ncbi:dockerin type I domain-containing protein [Aquisphaera insulae]|uniref:dockerin type I domain-containing protein n=1 Tax=Aquisphaera insulae TaxID=2712864 RepID=UPI0013EC9915|nr:dockerin type I domain-containing protein [Aquisphaera insulae]
MDRGRDERGHRLDFDALEPRHMPAGAGLWAATALGTGDVNGDGTVDPSDLRAFAVAFPSRAGSPNFNPAADFNRDGVINAKDARVILRSMAPLTTRRPLNVSLALAPEDRPDFKTSQISGGATMHQDFTIIGHTTPGSLVIEDNHKSRLSGGSSAYKFTGPAHAVDASGNFSIKARNTEGVNNNNFLVLDPFGGRLIIDFPVLWIPYASGRIGR